MSVIGRWYHIWNNIMQQNHAFIHLWLWNHVITSCQCTPWWKATWFDTASWGAGTGFLGLALALQGRRVTLSDNQSQAKKCTECFLYSLQFHFNSIVFFKDLLTWSDWKWQILPRVSWGDLTLPRRFRTFSREHLQSRCKGMKRVHTETAFVCFAQKSHPKSESIESMIETEWFLNLLPVTMFQGCCVSLVSFLSLLSWLL